jgi:hypothetical protein
MLPYLGQYGGISGVRCGRHGMAMVVRAFLLGKRMIGYPRYVVFMLCRLMNCLQRKIPSRWNSVSEPRTSSYSQFITVKSDSTVDVPGMKVAMPPQNCLDSGKRTPYRAPAIWEAHYAGLNFNLFKQVVPLWMARLNSLKYLSRSAQSS